MEAEPASEPVPPWLTHQEMIGDIAFLQQRMKELGERNIEILTAYSLEFPHAKVIEMIWQTHVDATPEEILAEIYRRESVARGDTVNEWTYTGNRK